MKSSFKALLCILSSVIFSCTEYDPADTDRKDWIKIPVKLSCEPLDTEAGGYSRSTHSAVSLTRISNVNCYLFQNGRLLNQEYTDDIGNFHVSIPSLHEKYNLYLLTNVGQKTIDSMTAESDMGTAVHVDYGSGTEYFSTIGSNGFPMAATITDFSSDSSTEYKVRRLVHTLYLKMNTSGLNTTEMEFTGVRIRQAPRDVYPFAARSKATNTIEGDAANLDSDDIERLNSGETVTLYLLENMRGDLIPDNASWKDKIPDNITSYEEKTRASYIEITARAITATATYENNIYRAYLGTGPSDFNVERSTYFTLTNSFTNDMIADEGWRIESDIPDITGKLAFVDTRYTADTAPDKNATGDIPDRPFKEVDAFYTMKGFIALYYIYKSNPDIEYRLTMEPNNSESKDCDAYVQYETRRVDDNFTALFIRTTYPIQNDGTGYSTNPSYTGGKSVSFRIESNDGLISDNLICRVLDKPLSVKFKYEGVSSSGTAISGNHNGKLNMYFTNPLGLKTGVHLTGQVYGKCEHRPNGTIRPGQTAEFTAQIRTGNVHKDGDKVDQTESNQILTEIPVTGRASRIDLYKPRTETGTGTFYRTTDGFHEFFMDIWNNTAWDDWTVLGTAGYNKHAEPYRLTLDFSIRFLSPNPNRILSVEKMPLHIANTLSGTDMGFLFHHSNDAAFTKTILFNNSGSISATINNVQDWNSNQVMATAGNYYDDGTLEDRMIHGVL